MTALSASERLELGELRNAMRVLLQARKLRLELLLVESDALERREPFAPPAKSPLRLTVIQGGKP